MTRWFIFETLTGTVLRDFEPLTGSWSIERNSAEEAKVEFPLATGEAAGMDWRNLATPWKHALGVEESGRLVGCPISSVSYLDDDARLSFGGKGFLAFLNRRTVKPVAALTKPLILPGSVPPLPDLSLNTGLSGLEYGTIMKRLVQQAQAWPSSSWPIRYEPDRAGTREKSYDASDHRKVGDALTDLTQLDQGVDVRFTLEWADATHVRWAMETGTDAQRVLQQSGAFTWSVSPDAGVSSGLSVSLDPGEMGSVGWATSGRGSDSLMSALSVDTKLLDAGFPLMEQVDSTHSDVVDQRTLQSYANNLTTVGGFLSAGWGMRVRADKHPLAGEINVGDLHRVEVSGSPMIADGAYWRRVEKMSGDQDGQWITLQFGEVLERA